MPSRDRLEWLRGRVDFKVDGWRRWAYWTSVMCIGASFGIRYGNPNVTVVPGYRLVEPATPAFATFTSKLYIAVAGVLLLSIVGRRAVIDTEDADE